MLWMIAVLLFVIILMFLFVLIQVFRNKETTMTRLQVYDKYDKKEQRDLYVDEELSKPIHQRLLYPLWHKVANSLGNLTPEATYKMFDEKLFAAGGFHGMTTNAFLLFWLVVAIAIACACGLIANYKYHLPANQIFGIALIGLVFALLLPIAVLNRRIRLRKAAMEKSLPGVLDLIYVSVQAGLSFDGAIAKVAEKMHGPLVEEFARMLQEIRMGMTRKDALKNLADRCKVQDVSLFTAALIQADQLGVGIANVLKIQASNVRMKRQLTIREMALKAPVKMLIPLVFFVFPAIFVILLGPGAITMIRQFSR